VNETAQRETPHLEIFWVVQTSNGEAKLLAAGCPLDRAEPYGDCLTYGPGHMKHGIAGVATGLSIPPFAPWCGRTNTKTGLADASSSIGRAICSSRTPMTSAMIARIATQFHSPSERTEVQSDLHYQSTETPNVLRSPTVAAVTK
jgi:hypothetical protein